MGKFLNFLLGAAILLFIMSFNKPAPAPEAVIAGVTSTTSSTVAPQEISLEQYRNLTRTFWINKTVEINKTVTIENRITTYEHFNASAVQHKQLINLRPKVCHTTGCSDGYDKCLTDVWDILGLRGSKYRTTFGTGFDPFFRQNTSEMIFRVYEDELGEFLTLNGTYWYITIPAVYQLINESDTHNVTVNFTREQIKIRRI